MIYGRNFGAPAIPDTPRTAFRKFKKRIRIEDGCGRPHAELVGIGQSEQERDMMLVIATNGHRNLHVVSVQTAGGVWYGIYAY
jgi:hypothetical protein